MRAKMTVWLAHGKQAAQIASWLVAIFALIYLGERTISEWQAISAAGVEIDVFWLFIAVLSLSVALFLGGLSWLTVERAVGIRRPWKDGLRTHYYSNIVKYMPGYAWQALSKAYLLRNASFASRTIAIAIITEYSLTFFAGSVLIIAFLRPFWAASILIGVSTYLLFVRGLTIFKINWLFMGLLVSSLGWIMFGTAVWTLNRAFTAIGLESWSGYVIAFCGSVILGLLAVGVPNGLGVREAVFLLLMADISNPNPLAISLIGIRVMLAMLELFAVGFVRLL